MNNSLYEEYMRSVLGYEPMGYSNTYDNMGYDNMYNNNMTNYNEMRNEEIEDCYPDIYRIVYPMVQKACMQNTRPLTRELIDSMTNEIYFAIDDNEITGQRLEKDADKVKDNRTEDRQQIRNNGLNDLIRILLLRELLGRPGFPIRPRPPIRPPRPPMRPPMGPGPRPPRPGMRTYNQNYNLYDEGYDILEY